MAVVGTGETARKFARALGLDPTKTRKISVVIEANEIVVVNVEMMPTEEDLNRFYGEFIQFKLEEVVRINSKGERAEDG